MFPLKTILHPTDFSDSAASAYRLACSVARDSGATLLVAHVTPPPTIIYGTGVIPPDPEAEQKHLHELLHQKHPGDPKVSQEFLLVQGDTVAEVLRLADERKAGMIVLGTHGRTGLSRLLMGSVAEQILRQARCPVLTVRLPA